MSATKATKAAKATNTVKAGDFYDISATKSVKGVKIAGRNGKVSTATIVLGKVPCKLPTFTNVQAGEELPLDAKTGIAAYKDEEINYAYNKLCALILTQQANKFAVTGDKDAVYADEAQAKAAFSVADKPTKEPAETWAELMQGGGQGAHAKASSAYNSIIDSLFKQWSADESIGERKAAIMTQPWRDDGMVSVDGVAMQVCTMAGTRFANVDRERKAANRAKVMAAMGEVIDQFNALEESDAATLGDDMPAGLELLRRCYAAAQQAIAADEKLEASDDDDL
jgi:hypothetical protein